MAGYKRGCCVASGLANLNNKELLFWVQPENDNYWICCRSAEDALERRKDEKIYDKQPTAIHGAKKFQSTRRSAIRAPKGYHNLN